VITTTTATVANLHEVLGLDFTVACCELTEALLQQERKDSPGNRAAVADARARIDGLLDMYAAAGFLRR
jgi:hypothetical protein